MVVNKITMGDLRPVSAVPECLDNTWVPPECYDRSDVDRLASIRREFNGALLSSDQLIINRAYTYNNRLLGEIYKHKSEAAAFSQALNKQDIIIFLFNENSPSDLPKFKTRHAGSEEDQFLNFQKIVSSSDASCLRFSWDSDEENNKIIDKQLAGRFHSYFSAIYDEIDLAVITKELLVPDEKADAFQDQLLKLQAATRNIGSQRISKTTPRRATRAELYAEFVNGDTYMDGIDERIPFARHIKTLLDIKYNCNLPDALGKFCINAEGDFDRTILQEIGQGAALDTFQEEDREAFYALLSSTAFDRMTNSAALDFLADLSLQDIMEIRGFRAWSDYINFVHDIVPFANSKSRLGDHPILQPGFQENLGKAYGGLMEAAAQIVRRREKIETIHGWCEITVSVIGQGLKFIVRLGRYGELEIPEELPPMVAAAVAPILIEITMGYDKNGKRHVLKKYPLLKKRLDDPSAVFRKMIDDIKRQARGKSIKGLSTEEASHDDRKSTLNLPESD